MNNQCKAVLFGGLFSAASLLACNSAEKPAAVSVETAPAEAPAREVFSLQKGRLSSSLQIPGELAAYQQVDLYAKEGSFVKKVYVDIGSEVRTGQLLVS